MPIFDISDISKKDKDKSLAGALELLIEAPPHLSPVCGKQPRYVKNNCVFAVQTSKLDHVRDILADDSGKWINNRQHKFLFEKTEDGGFQKVRDPFIDKHVSDELYTLHRHFHLNKDSRDYHRTITFVTGICAMIFISFY